MKQIKFTLVIVFVMIFISCNTTKQPLASTPFYNPKNKKVVKKKKESNQLVWYQKPTKKDIRKQKESIKGRKEEYMVWYIPPPRKCDPYNRVSDDTKCGAIELANNCDNKWLRKWILFGYTSSQ